MTTPSPALAALSGAPIAFFGIDTRDRALEELHGRPAQEDPVRPGSPGPTATH